LSNQGDGSRHRGGCGGESGGRSKNHKNRRRLFGGDNEPRGNKKDGRPEPSAIIWLKKLSERGGKSIGIRIDAEKRTKKCVCRAHR